MRSRALALWLLVVVTLSCASAYSATIHGYVLDPNWYAKHPKLTFPQVYGTGQYEYGVADSEVAERHTDFLRAGLEPNTWTSMLRTSTER